MQLKETRTADSIRCDATNPKQSGLNAWVGIHPRSRNAMLATPKSPSITPEMQECVAEQ